ncbi:Protein phosphatase 2C 2 [Mycoemilia scoparia]|uniref:protein-serine/threonine phosphatase n=1 Tax=Mycoemilia scoparia TaxID=417184 RepID=A0A9W7ZJ02_9FUNG|nr:Protein phosphatase 2C 2 [Mycoemilia scoparia]
MGQTLSEPITEKHTTSGEDKRFLYAASAMQGWRVTMEDAHTTLLDISDGEGENNGSAFFAVFDGHGGKTSAEYAGKNLHHFIRKRPEFLARQFEQAIKKGFLDTDEHLQQDSKMIQDPSGCTAVCLLITKDNEVYCGNAGDSRCVLGSSGKAIPLSSDHKPNNEIEFRRITEGGGFVEFGRVNGNLALSRAIGDFEFKKNPSLTPEKQVVTADPDVTKHDLSERDDFIVVACDGIWDCMSNEEVILEVSKQIASGIPLSTVCENVMELCLAKESHFGGLGCDNMTIVIIGLLNGKTKEEWVEKVKKTVDSLPPSTQQFDNKPGILSTERTTIIGQLKNEVDSDHDISSEEEYHDQQTGGSAQPNSKGRNWGKEEDEASDEYQ